MKQTAADIMTTKLVLLRPSDSVPRIAALLGEHQISAAPVVDAQGRLLGMVSEDDLIRPLGGKVETRRAWWLEMLAEGEALAPDFLDYLKRESRTAAELMTRDVISVSPEATVEEVVDLLIRHRIKRVPVLRDGHLAGIVSRADIIRNLPRAGAGR
ncbi:CBS domain-containing protein [Acidocella sp.]|uniref:CBS domain-containing protein n=1 Tax=Acidocella sp. TaxID=50710 RepID=UPI003D03211C